MKKIIFFLLLIYSGNGFGQKYELTFIITDSPKNPVVLRSGFGIHQGSKGIVKLDISNDTIVCPAMKSGKYAFQFKSAKKEARVIFELTSDTLIQVILQDPDDPVRFRD